MSSRDLLANSRSLTIRSDGAMSAIKRPPLSVKAIFVKAENDAEAAKWVSLERRDEELGLLGTPH